MYTESFLHFGEQKTFFSFQIVFFFHFYSVTVLFLSQQRLIIISNLVDVKK